MLHQRSRVTVEGVQQRHHDHRRGEHRDRAEEPQQQGRREVKSPQAHRPEVAAADHRQLYVFRWDVAAGSADQIVGVDEAPGGLDEARKGQEEADEE